MIEWTWFLTILSLTATILNIKKKKVCFFIWLITDALWCIIDFKAGIYSQSMLQLTYFGLSIWGIIEWRKKK